MDDLQLPNGHRIEEQKNTFVSQPTSFIGRMEDLRKVQEMLAEPSCRLVSLVGTGGIGKTRLGIEIAIQMQSAFVDGAYFVPLQGLTSEVQVAATIANSTSCVLYGNQDAFTQLKRHLHDKEMLLLLDNFEHLLDAAHLIVDLLDAAKGLKVLVTSREVLNLRAEWVWLVTGMRFPDDIDGEIAESDSAVHLFDNYARRLLPGFSLGHEKVHVIRICQLVDGVPLALELAASWLKSLTCEMIAEEIQRSLDFLDTNMRDMPERHRSMRAVFDQSWKLLSEQERDVYRQLSIFRGGFSSEAGAQIVGASRVLMNSLVDKSLVSYQSGRYHLHGVLRQYAQQHLDMEGDLLEYLLEAHASYYVKFLADRLHTFRADKNSLDEILIELDNIQLAWESVIAGKQFKHLPSAIYCLGDVINFWVPFHEGIKIFAPAIETYRTWHNFPETLPIYVALLTSQSVYHGRLMQIAEAVALLEECQALLEEYDFRPQAYAGSDPLVLLGTAHLFQGNFDDALSYGHRAAANGERYNDIPNAGMANHLLGMTYLAVGQLEEARQFGQLGLSQSKQTKNLSMCAHCTDHLGDTAIAARDPAMAEHYFAEGYRYRLAINERTNLPQSMALLGKAKLAQGQYQEAADWFDKSVSLYTTYGDTAALIIPKSQLALCYARMNERELARDLFLDAIYAAELTHVVPLWLSLIINIGEFHAQLGNEERCVELLSTVLHHPMFDRRRGVAVDVQKRLGDFAKTMSEELYYAAIKAGIESDFEGTILALEHDVNSAITNASPIKPHKGDQDEFYAKGLEPLSDRELEVLALIAAGLTNQEIAEALIVTVGTVKSHTHSIYSKLGVKNRTQSIKLARELNLI